MGFVDSVDVSIYLSSYIKAVFLTTMGNPFDVYLNIPVMVAINPLFQIGKSFWLKGIEDTFGNFKVEAEIENLYQKTFEGNACSFYDKSEHFSMIRGIPGVCDSSYSGLMTKGFGLALSRHFETIENIRGTL